MDKIKLDLTGYFASNKKESDSVAFLSLGGYIKRSARFDKLVIFSDKRRLLAKDGEVCDVHPHEKYPWIETAYGARISFLPDEFDAICIPLAKESDFDKEEGPQVTEEQNMEER